MKKFAFRLAATTGLVGALFLASESMAAVDNGAMAPNFTLTDTNGNTVNLSDFKGKNVVLEWTNHQCPYVVKHYSTDNMQGLQKDATENETVWLSIVSSAEGKQGFVTPEEGNKIIEETGAAQTAKLLDPTGEVGKMFGAKTTPHMYVINAEGALVYQGAIDDNNSYKPETVEGATNYVSAALTSLEAGTPVEVAQSKPYGCSIKY